MIHALLTYLGTFCIPAPDECSTVLGVSAIEARSRAKMQLNYRSSGRATETRRGETCPVALKDPSNNLERFLQKFVTESRGIGTNGLPEEASSTMGGLGEFDVMNLTCRRRESLHFAIGLLRKISAKTVNMCGAVLPHSRPGSDFLSGDTHRRSDSASRTFSPSCMCGATQLLA